eukprot:jgi/Phyca11/16110/fgenesh1_pg.PHYCAscaffold_17_\
MAMPRMKVICQDMKEHSVEYKNSELYKSRPHAAADFVRMFLFPFVAIDFDTAFNQLSVACAKKTSSHVRMFLFPFVAIDFDTAFNQLSVACAKKTSSHIEYHLQ